jgi:recyclin-1
VLALPVDLVSSAATTIASPFQRSAIKSQNENGKQNDTTPQSTPPSTPRSSSTNLRKIKTESVISQSSASSIKSPSTPTVSSSRASSDGASINDPTDVLETAQTQLDMMQDLLSLELALQLIHLNKDSEKRVQRFISIGFPGRMKHDM